MANLNKLFSEFNDKITLTPEKSQSLKTSRDALKKDIRTWFTDKEKLQPKFCWQGSYAMKTVVNPLGDKEYDLDDGVYIQGYEDITMEDWVSPSTVHSWIKDAVKDRTKMDVINKDTCVRVPYAAGYHIDLPMYIYKDEIAYLAHKSNTRKNRHDFMDEFLAYWSTKGILDAQMFVGELGVAKSIYWYSKKVIL